MTATRTRRPSLADRLEDERPLDAAAAGAAVDAVALINEKVREKGMLQSRLSKVLGITEGRVSQVLNGDGNIRISTLARFLRAAGYRLRISAVPVERAPQQSNAMPLAGRRTLFSAHKTVTCLTKSGVSEGNVWEFSDIDPTELRAQEVYSWVLKVSATGRTEDSVRDLPIQVGGAIRAGV